MALEKGDDIVEQSITNKDIVRCRRHRYRDGN